jgi:hypothetical protein
VIESGKKYSITGIVASAIEVTGGFVALKPPSGDIVQIAYTEFGWHPTLLRSFEQATTPDGVPAIRRRH